MKSNLWHWICNDTRIVAAIFSEAIRLVFLNSAYL